MKRHTPMIFTGLLLAAAACSGIDNGGTAPDIMDLTTSAAYRIPSGATISVSPQDAQVAPGTTVKLSTTVNSATGQTIRGVGSLAVTWVSSDTTIARVSSNGIVLGRSPGVVTVRAITGSQSAESKITVGVEGSAPVSTVDTAISTPTTSTASTSGTTSTTSGTTTSTATAPAPTPVSGGQGGSVSSAAFLYDDFSKYSSTTDLVANVSTIAGGPGDYRTVLYTDGHNPDLLTLDKTVLYNGHATMKYNQPGGNGLTPEMWPSFPGGKTYSNVWVRVKIRWSPGYTTTGSLTNSANAYKLLAFGFAGVNGRAEVGISNTNQYQVAWNSVSSSTGTTLANSPFGMAGNIAQEWTDGGWYDYIFCYEVLSATSARVRFWVAKDGQTPVLRGTAIGGPVTAGAPMPLVNRVLLGQNFNQQRLAGQTQALWYGQWEVVDGTQHPDPYGLH